MRGRTCFAVTDLVNFLTRGATDPPRWVDVLGWRTAEADEALDPLQDLDTLFPPRSRSDFPLDPDDRTDHR